MAAPARFTFDLDLGGGHTSATQPSVPENLVSQLVTQAREEAYAQGIAAGEKSASAAAATAIADAANAIAAQTAAMSANLDQSGQTNLREAIELAASIGRKLATNLLARQPTAELEVLIAECMANLDGVPHLVIRCHPDVADAVREAATANMATSGYSGRLVVMGDPDQRLGDGRLEWVDGGLVRDINAISSSIDEKISAYLAGRTGTAPQETEQ
ncbi:FliH/SctL family protein [Devosia rhodophyticola]|uniref:FliH/SctL family protein n=1 Tax=Devosia rhodophyticola TaxID=3026423 RepID=A0ABY7YV28_9HYPH|nr:FliH/SctL family protein [Devosia rhodophyticola]WDR04963.1 FliH/SctL family protein [Devosia rhodophyticola]